MAVKIDFSLHFHLFFTADPEEYNCSVKTEEEWEREKESSIVVGSWFILLSLASLVSRTLTLVQDRLGNISVTIPSHDF